MSCTDIPLSPALPGVRVVSLPSPSSLPAVPKHRTSQMITDLNLSALELPDGLKPGPSRKRLLHTPLQVKLELRRLASVQAALQELDGKVTVQIETMSKALASENKVVTPHKSLNPNSFSNPSHFEQTEPRFVHAKGTNPQF